MLSVLFCSVPCISAHVLHRVEARWVDSCLSATRLENTSGAFCHSKIAVERGLVKLNQSSGVFFSICHCHPLRSWTELSLDRRFILILDQGRLHVCLWVPEVNQEVFQHRLPLGSSTVVASAYHDRIIEKWVALSSRVNLHPVRTHWFLQMIASFCYIIKTNSSSDKGPFRGET